MTEFVKGQWYTDGKQYWQYIKQGKDANGNTIHYIRLAGDVVEFAYDVDTLIPASLTPDFSDAKVGDECFSPIHGIGYFTMMKHKWGETTVVYDNGVMDYAVCAKCTTTHPLRYNSFAQFKAYWAEQALDMEGEQ